MDHNYNNLGRSDRVFSNDLVCDTGNFFGCTVRTFRRLFRRMGSDKRHLVSRDWLVRSGMVRDSEYFRICRKLVRINLSVSMERGSKCLFKLGSFFSGLWGIIRNTFSNLGTSIANAIGGAVKSGINGVISMIQNTVNSAIRIINGAINLINRLPGVSVGNVGYLSLPRLAKGGILTNGRAIVAEAGPEIVEMVNGKTIVTPLSGTAKNNGT